jgi:ABC-type multidrug transport system fused ATPase/permease subunit
MIAFFRRLWPLLSLRTRRRLAVAAGAMVAVTSLEGLGLLVLMPLLQLLTTGNLRIQPGTPQRAADLLGVHDGGRLALYLAIAALVLYASKSIIAIAVLRWNTRNAMVEETLLVGRLMRIYLSVPLQTHHDLNSATFQRTVNSSVRQLFAQAFVISFSALADVLSVLIVAAILVVSDPWMALIGAAYFAVAVGAYQWRLRATLRRAAAEVHEEQAAVFRSVQQSLGAVRELKIRNVEDHFAHDVQRARHAMLDAYRETALAAVQPRYVLELVMVGAAAVVATFAFMTRSPESATASIALFLAGGFRILAPLNKVVTGMSQAKIALPSLDQIQHDLDELGPLAEAERFEPGTVAELQPALEVRGVDFAYPGGPTVVRDVSITVRPGEAVALVGGSGAGKSTLVDLALGLLEPTAGEIAIDGHPLRDVRRQWQRMVGYVPQTIALVDDTVRANITLGLPLDEEALVDAIARAQLTDVVAALPEGLDTPIGERGVRLSGGQRQRLGVARALYHRPVALVLDEATAALDNETESRLTEVLDALRGTVTTITIAHRLSTVRNADRTYYLEHGRVVDVGSFQELASRNDGFARMLELASLERSS